MAEEKKRPDTTPPPVPRVTRLKDAVRHMKEGGTMAGPDIDDLYNLLDDIDKAGQAKVPHPEEKAS